MRQSITLQTNDNSISAGDILGRISFAASSESDGAESRWVAAGIYAEASGDFLVSQNPTNLVLATSDNNGIVSRLRVSNSGHFLPYVSNTYDLGSSNFKFRNVFAASGFLDKIETTGIQLTGSANQSGLLYINSGDLIASSPNVLFSNSSPTSPKLIFRASGSITPDISLNILTTASGTVSGVQTLSFQGSAGELFSITDVLDTGTIYSVNDISGLELLGVDADGTVRLAKYGANVAVGNVTPTQKLHVNGSIRVSGAFFDSLNSPGTSGQVLVSTSGGTDWRSLSEITGVDGVGVSGYVARWIDADTISSGVIYDNGTNIGIGTDSPSYKLHLSNGAFYTNGDGSAVSYYINGGNAIRVPSATVNSTVFFDSPILRFRNPAVGSATQLYLNSSGLSIGDTTLTPARLFVLNDTATRTGILVRGAASQSADLFQVQNSASTELFHIDAGGSISGVGSGIFMQRVGIRTTIPIAPLHVKGSGDTSATFILNLENGSGTNMLRVRDDGGIHIGPTTAVGNGALISASNGSDNPATSTTAGLRYRSSLNPTSTGVDHFITNYQGSKTFTTGNGQTLRVQGGFAPTSGDGTYEFIAVTGSINQTGGSTGVTRGIWVRPVVTNAADYRAVETYNNAGYSIYADGTASGYFAGNVGIAVLAPSEKLEVLGAIRARVTSPGAGNGDVYAFKIHEHNGNNDRLGLGIHDTGDAFLSLRSDTSVVTRIDSNGNSYFMGGNVGVGINAPTVRLHVRSGTGDVSESGGLIVEGTGTGARVWQLTPTTSDTLLLAVPGLRVAAFNPAGKFFAGGLSGPTGAAARFTASTSGITVGTNYATAIPTPNGALIEGRVGIGTTNPVYNLDIEDASTPAVRVIRTGGSRLLFGSDGGGSYIGTFSNNQLRFFTNSTEKARINESGYFGINTTNPQYLLDVSGTIRGEHVTAITKSFLIEHPTKPGKQLRYASLEGPENGVYVRGITTENEIELPEYWGELVDLRSVTVNLTAIKYPQPNLCVEKITSRSIRVASDRPIMASYTIFGERKDVAKLEVESWR